MALERVRKDDTVMIIAGRERGKTGKVLRTLPDKNRVVVERINLVKRHTKPRPMRDSSRMGGTQMAPGGIIDRPSPVSASNVMLVCPTCKLPTRIGYRFKEAKGGQQVKVRVCKRDGCGQEIDR